MSCFGCFNAKHVDPAPPPPNVPQPQAQADEAVTTSKHIPLDHANDPVTAIDFELSTAMLVLPFEEFKKQGRICKSIKSWRDKALSEGLLVVHVKSGSDRPLAGKVVIFVSHTWWDRAFTDETNDPADPYDKGARLYGGLPRRKERGHRQTMGSCVQGK